MAISIEIITQGIGTLIERLNPLNYTRRFERIAHQNADIVKQSLIRHTPRRTGFLASQYQISVAKQGNDFHISVSNPTFYGPYVNLGTGIFVGRDLIRPRTARVLRFQAGGQILYRRFVRGQRGQFFVQRALQAVSRDLERTTSIGIQAELDGR